MEWTPASFRSSSFLMLHTVDMYVLYVGISNNLICSHHDVLSICDNYSSINKAEHKALSIIKHLLAGIFKNNFPLFI